MKKLLKPLMIATAVGCSALMLTTPLVAATKTLIQEGWYIRLVAKSGDLKESSTVFGYLQGASDGKDKYDSEALSPFGSSYLYTTLYHEDFDKADEYKSDYRDFAKTGQKSDTWTIVVHSGDPDAEVTLSWNGVTHVKKYDQDDFKENKTKGMAILGRMQLVDVKTAQEIDVKSKSNMSYTFNMEGANEREFKCILLKDGEEPRVFEAATEQESAELLAENQSLSEKAAVAQEEEASQMMPPTFEKRHKHREKKRQERMKKEQQEAY